MKRKPFRQRRPYRRSPRAPFRFRGWRGATEDEILYGKPGALVPTMVLTGPDVIASAPKPRHIDR